jgi:hypothetical protein
MKIEEEDENEDEGGLHVSVPILLILLILSVFSGQQVPAVPMQSACGVETL